MLPVVQVALNRHGGLYVNRQKLPLMVCERVLEFKSYEFIATTNRGTDEAPLLHNNSSPVNKQVEISLFCTRHLICWISKCWNLLFQFCPVIGLHCLGGPGFCSRSVSDLFYMYLFFIGSPRKPVIHVSVASSFFLKNVLLKVYKLFVRFDVCNGRKKFHLC